MFIALCRMSLTEEQINLLDFDSTQTFDSDQKSLFTNHIDANGGSSVTSSAHIVPSTQHTQHTHSITASVPHQPQLTTTMQLSPEMMALSKSSLEVNASIFTPSSSISIELFRSMFKPNTKWRCRRSMSMEMVPMMRILFHLNHLHAPIMAKKLW